MKAEHLRSGHHFIFAQKVQQQLLHRYSLLSNTSYVEKFLGKLSQKTFIPKNYRQSFKASNPNWRAKKSAEGKLNKKCRPVKMIGKVRWRLWKRSMRLRLRLWGDKWKNYKSRRNRYPKTQLRLTRAHRRYFCTKIPGFIKDEMFGNQWVKIDKIYSCNTTFPSMMNVKLCMQGTVCFLERWP